MKLIRINESQRKRLFEAYRDGFSLKNLTMIGEGQFGGENNSEAQYEYCRKFLGEPISKGTSRVVFTMDDNTVLKLAYGNWEAGVEQNHNERWLFERTKSPILTRVFACDENNSTWIISEAVLPAREIDFEKIFGIPFDSIYRQNSIPMKKCLSDKKGDIDIGFNEYFDDIKYYCAERTDGFTISAILKYITLKYLHHSTLIDNRIASIINGDWLQEDLKAWVKELVKLVESVGMADIEKLENFGMVNRDGTPKIVLLDSGFTMDVGRKYYTRKWQR